jgi:hypothetical protein
MLTARLLEAQRSALEEQLAAGEPVTDAQQERYLALAAFSVALACELYKYEFGRLPQTPGALLAEEYMNDWPGNPRSDWQPLPFDCGPAITTFNRGFPGTETISLREAPEGGLAFAVRIYDDSSNLLLDYQSPRAVWLETEAQLNAMDYLAYEQELSQRYPDRALWPANGIVRPAPVPAGQPSGRRQAVETAGG